jgi:hypothetical protein
VTAGRDDDALTWDGDDDPTLDVGSAPPTDAKGLPEGWNAVGKGSEPAEPEAVEADARTADAPAAEAATPTVAQPMGNATLITIGVLGGFAALYTVGWIVGGFRLQGSAQYLVADVMFQGSFWLAVLAPALWFVTVFLLTRASATWVRIVWLVAGAVLLVPWPFIMIGAVGQ